MIGEEGKERGKEEQRERVLFQNQKRNEQAQTEYRNYDNKPDLLLRVLLSETQGGQWLYRGYRRFTDHDQSLERIHPLRTAVISSIHQSTAVGNVPHSSVVTEITGNGVSCGIAACLHILVSRESLSEFLNHSTTLRAVDNSD